MGNLGDIMLKKFLICLLTTIFLLGQANIVWADKNKQETPKTLSPSTKYIFHGHAEINEGAKGQDGNAQLFTGETSTVEEGTKLKMTVSSVISTGYNEEGDEFFAEIVDDLQTENGVLIPASTIAHGKVTGMDGSKTLGRDAYVTLDFDYLITPDGREIPIEGSMTTKRHPVANTAKIIAEDVGYTVAGGLAGSYLALKFLGLGAAVSTNGATVAGGAGLGAVAGLGIGLGRQGQEVLLAPGDEISVKLKGNFKLPVMTEEAFTEKELFCKGLDVKITNYSLEKDPFGEPNTITLSLLIANRTPKTFSSFDIALINDYKSVYHASPFGETDLWFMQIKPGMYTTGKLSFSVDNPKRKHWLVFYDNRTRKPLAKISVDNAKRKIKKARKSKKR